MKVSETTFIIKREWIPSPLPPVKIVKPKKLSLGEKRKNEIEQRIYGRV